MKIFSKILMTCALLAVSAPVLAQGDDLGAANETAVELYSKEYIAHPHGKYVLKGILWVESRNGKYKFGDGSYGIAQMEVPTALHVAGVYGFKVPDAEEAVIKTLMNDDIMSIRLAAAYLGLLEQRFGSLAKAVVAYNVGPTKGQGMIRSKRRLPGVYLNKVMSFAYQELTSDMISAERLSGRSFSARIKRYLDLQINWRYLYIKDVLATPAHPARAALNEALLYSYLAAVLALYFLYRLHMNRSAARQESRACDTSWGQDDPVW